MRNVQDAGQGLQYLEQSERAKERQKMRAERQAEVCSHRTQWSLLGMCQEVMLKYNTEWDSPPRPQSFLNAGSENMILPVLRTVSGAFHALYY